MQVFFTTHIQGEAAELVDTESFHCIKVLRHKEGDLIYFVDGVGGFYKAEITACLKESTQLKIIESAHNYRKRNHHFHLAIAPTKNMDRIEWMVEKAVEAGIDEFSFLLCKKSERKVLKLDRLQKIVSSAMKQSVQAYLPKLNELISFPNFIKNQEGNQSNKFIAWCGEGEKHSLKSIQPNENVLVLIGPEGDFSEDETKLAFEKGFKGLSLGENRLRTETAGLFVCNALSLINQ